MKKRMEPICRWSKWMINLRMNWLLFYWWPRIITQLQRCLEIRVEFVPWLRLVFSFPHEKLHSAILNCRKKNCCLHIPQKWKTRAQNTRGWSALGSQIFALISRQKNKNKWWLIWIKSYKSRHLFGSQDTTVGNKRNIYVKWFKWRFPEINEFKKYTSVKQF